MQDPSFSTLALLDALAAPTLLLGADGALCALNRAALRCLGGTREQLTGRLLEQLVSSTDRALVRGVLRDIQPADASTSILVRGIGPDGAEAAWTLTLSAVCEREQRGVLVGLRDVDAEERARVADRHELFEHCPDLVFEVRVTPDGRFVQESYNPATLRATGTTLSQVRGHELHEFLSASAARSVTANYQRCVDAGQAIDYESEIDFGAGPRSYHTFLVPFRDAAGRIARIAGFSRDITERRHAERALRESERRFAAAFQAMPYSVSVSDLKTGRYLSCNAGFERISGYRRDEVVGRTSHELNLWVDAADRDELVRRISATGQVRGMEIRFRAKDGHIVVALCHCDVIEVEGAPCLLNTFEDVSERLRVTNALQASEEARRQADALLATAFRASPDAMAILDLDHDAYLEINPAFEHIYGYTRAEVIGKTPDELGIFAVPEDRPRF
ncbi:MAG TPA: PAS domain S-box protein, partial [Polyangiales bacterium]